MFTERFSAGVRPEAREKRTEDLAALEQAEAGLSADLQGEGQTDLARLALLFTLATDTAEVRAASRPVESVDRSVIQRALVGEA